MRHALLIAEFVVLCLLMPGAIIAFRIAPFMFVFLWAATLYAFLVLRRVKNRTWAEIWGWNSVRWRNIRPILLRWVAACAGMVVFLYFYNPSQLFFLVRERPDFVPYLLVIYPVISALPQEFVFCTYFFERFRVFFKNGAGMVLASALVFAYAHILYINPVAPVLSLAGGLIFAQTYRKTGSLALVTIEHSLYGNALFLIGLGAYFYSGNVPQ